MKTKCPFLYVLQILLVTASWVTQADAQQPIAAEQRGEPSYAQSIRYENQQTFNAGPAKDKDNNIWVYTAAFADTFGMPKAGIDALVGAEAVAFRVEDPGYKTCGMGGKAENCMKNTRYMMDVYIDERKHSLPWADAAQMADWLGEYNSSQWLRIGTSHLDERSGRRSPSPSGAVTSTILQGDKTLRPFANSDTHREVFWMHNGSTDRDRLSDSGWNHLPIYGYKRNAIDGLTLISFATYPTVSGSNRELNLRLVERLRVQARTLRLFHEVVIPTRFVEARAQLVKQQQEQDQQFYRSLFRSPSGANPEATPLPSSN